MAIGAGKKLYYFTASYPWGVGQTWKNSELTYLREYFDRITVVPYCYEGNFDSPKALPAGVSAERPLFLEGAPKLDWRAVLGAVNGRADHYVREFLRKRPLNRARLASWLGASVQTSRLLRHPLIRRIMENPDRDTSLYFFWGRGSCDFLPFVDKRRFRSVVVRFHRYDLYEDENAGYIPYRRQLLESISLAGPVSESGRRHLRDLYPDVPTPIRVLRLGVPRQEALSMSSDGVLRILSCSYVVPRKRVDLIAEALRTVGMPVHWTHVGDGPDLNALRQKVATLPANVEVDLPGAIAAEKLFDFYKQRPVDVFVNVSTSEGVPMTIQECLSGGVPALATDVGGTREIVDDEVGTLLPADVTPQQLATELERFNALSDSDKRRRREAAMQRHRERCDVEVLTRQLASLLLEPGA